MADPTPQSAADLYDLGDTSHDPSVDEPIAGAPPAPPVAASPAQPTPAEQRSLPPRGESGRFVKPEDAPPAHSRQTLRLARDLGISEEEIAATPPDMLDDVVYHAHRHQIRLNREHSQSAALGGAAPPAATPPPALAPDFNEEDYDPGLMGVIKALKARLDRVEGVEAQRMNASLTEQCDQFFAEDEATFGKGRYHEIDPNGPDMIRRSAIIALARNQSASLSIRGKLAKAREILYGKAVAPAEGKTSGPGLTTPETDAWRAGGLARPTHRAPSAEPPSELKAMRTAARILRETSGSDNGVDDYDAFPG